MVVAAVVRGCGNKSIADQLGVAVSTVSSHLRAALRKLGFETRAQLVAIHQHLRWRAVERTDPVTRWRVDDDELASLTIGVDPPRWPADLHRAERQICRLLVRGRSVAEIARTRGASARTVTNQLYGMYRRYGVSHRAEFIVAMLDRAYQR